MPRIKIKYSIEGSEWSLLRNKGKDRNKGNDKKNKGKGKGKWRRRDQRSKDNIYHDDPLIKLKKCGKIAAEKLLTLNLRTVEELLKENSEDFLRKD